MLWNMIKRLFVRGLAIDLGTVNTLIYSQGRGIVLNEPSLIAVNRFTRDVVAVGREAAPMMEREPWDVIVHRPVENGVVADYALTELILRFFLRRLRRDRLIPRGAYTVVLGTPNSATGLEHRGAQDAVLRAGASRVSLVDEGVAAAISADLFFEDPRARLIVDIGGGTTNISIVSAAGTILSHSLDVAGLATDRAIREYIRQEYRVLIGEQSAEKMKIELGSALPSMEDRSLQVVGKSIADGKPRELEIYSDEICHAIHRQIRSIIESVQLIIAEASPEITADLYGTGIMLAGGGSLLQDLETRIRDEVELSVTRAENPLEAVALGAGRLLDYPDLLERFQVRDDIPSWELETEIDYALEAQQVESV